MSTLATEVDQARAWVVRLEDAKAKAIGLPISAARREIARELKLAPGTLETLRKNRAKAVAWHVFERLRTGVAQLLESEIVRMEQELDAVRRADPGDRAAALREAEAALERARSVLGK